jgi:hypothetical protein
VPGLVAKWFAGEESVSVTYDQPEDRPGENGERERVREHEGKPPMGGVPPREAADRDQSGRHADSERRDAKAAEHPGPGEQAAEQDRRQRDRHERGTSIGRR